APARRPAARHAQPLPDRAVLARRLVHALERQQSGARRAARALRDRRRRNSFLLLEPDFALSWLRVHPAARRAALQRARRDAGRGQADLELGPGTHSNTGGKVKNITLLLALWAPFQVLA